MTTPDDIEVVRDLVAGYVQWLIDTYPHESDDILSYYSPERIRQALDEVGLDYMPPKGLALIARLDGVPVGCVLARPLEPGVAEMKRLFIAPAARGRGLGVGLVRALIGHMSCWGNSTVRLDTAVFLTDAIALYRRLGFVEIEPYFDVPAEAQKTAIFMELKALTSGGVTAGEVDTRGGEEPGSRIDCQASANSHPSG